MIFVAGIDEDEEHFNYELFTCLVSGNHQIVVVTVTRGFFGRNSRHDQKVAIAVCLDFSPVRSERGVTEAISKNV